MNIIKIYIALSEELSEEQSDLADYIRSLNDLYQKRGIFFELNFSKNAANQIIYEETDDDQNIRNSNYFYLIFGRIYDKNLRTKFETALNTFQNNGLPKIYTYFKNLPNEVAPDQGIIDFMNRLDQVVGHYYSQFNHIDSIKLNFLIELTREFSEDRLEFKDGNAFINDIKILSLDNMPFYQYNTPLQQLNQTKEKLQQEIAEERNLFKLYPDNDDLFDKLTALNIERNNVAEQIRKIEKNVLELYNKISDSRNSGRELTWRTIEAEKCLNAGDYEGALEILDDPEWYNELEHAELRLEHAKLQINDEYNSIGSLIHEKLIYIYTLKAQGISANTLQKVYFWYEEITNLAKKHTIELDCVFDYITFLYEQNDFQKAIELGEWLQPFYSKSEEKGKLLNILGTCYSKTHDYKQAEKSFRTVLDICRCLVQKDAEAHEQKLAATCNSFANMLNITNNYKDAEDLYQEALDICHRLVKKMRMSMNLIWQPPAIITLTCYII